MFPQSSRTRACARVCVFFFLQILYRNFQGHSNKPNPFGKKKLAQLLFFFRSRIFASPFQHRHHQSSSSSSNIRRRRGFFPSPRSSPLFFFVFFSSTGPSLQRRPRRSQHRDGRQRRAPHHQEGLSFFWKGKRRRETETRFFLPFVKLCKVSFFKSTSCERLFPFTTTL